MRRAGHRRGAAGPGRRRLPPNKQLRRGLRLRIRLRRWRARGLEARGGVGAGGGGGGRRVVLGGRRRGAACGRARGGRGRGADGLPATTVQSGASWMTTGRASCVRNAVAMTTTVNYYFGANVLSPSTGIVLNNEMDDFSVPSNHPTPDHLPPAPANFIAPGKRPLSSMMPAIILKGGQLAGVVGASGGTNIIAAVTQVFLNHFVVGLGPLASVQRARIYHKLVPKYEDETIVDDGQVIQRSGEAREFLRRKGHRLESTASGAVCQLIVQELPESMPKEINVYRGMLTSPKRRQPCRIIMCITKSIVLPLDVIS